MQSHAHWIEMKQSLIKYFVYVWVTRGKTYCDVYATDQKQPDKEYVLSSTFTDLNENISKVTGLKGAELDLFIRDHQRRLTGLSTVGTRGQWDYAQPVIKEWLTQLHREIETIVKGLNVSASAVRVEIISPFSKLYPTLKYHCIERYMDNQGEVCIR